jgi:hypothetical protein
VGLDPKTQMSLQRTKNSNVCCPHPNPTRFYQEILPLSWCVSLWHGCHTLTTRRSYHP